MANTKHNDAEKAAIAERQAFALDFRKSGWSYRDIGKKLTISHEQARRDVESQLKALSKLNEDKADELRALELERLDKMTRSLDRMVEAGNVGAISTMLRVMERRAKLLGLDAPEKKDINLDVTKLTDDELFTLTQS